MKSLRRREFLSGSLVAGSFLLVNRFTTSEASVGHPNCRSELGVDPALVMWSPAEFECPICKTKNTFMVWDSYGSYIYEWPSKYQLVFWPYTDPQSWYSCKKCKLSIFMSEFTKIPTERIPDLTRTLETAALPAQHERSPQNNPLPPYLDIPTSARLSVAENVYRTLGRIDDNFWDHFYRVLGYHYQAENQKVQAEKARRKSIALTEKLLADQKNNGRRKELLFTLGSMNHFTLEDTRALKAFEEARKLKFESSDLTSEQNRNYDHYLAKLIKEYVEMIKKGQGPRDKAGSNID
jgi:hypothetical protein